MTDKEKILLRKIAQVLQQPRNRFGCIQGRTNAREEAGPEIMSKLPHGGSDAADQCAMILQSLIGDPVKSIMDSPPRASLPSQWEVRG